MFSFILELSLLSTLWLISSDSLTLSLVSSTLFCWYNALSIWSLSSSVSTLLFRQAISKSISPRSKIYRSSLNKFLLSLFMIPLSFKCMLIKLGQQQSASHNIWIYLGSKFMPEKSKWFRRVVWSKYLFIAKMNCLLSFACSSFLLLKRL